VGGVGGTTVLLGEDVALRAKVFEALADPARLRLVLHLAQAGPARGVELAEACGMSVALLLHHWKILAEAGLLSTRREGAGRYCSLNVAALKTAVGALLG
jgi:DNA-binding transcriptional ArsR family regulator